MFALKMIINYLINSGSLEDYQENSIARPVLIGQVTLPSSRLQRERVLQYLSRLRSYGGFFTANAKMKSANVRESLMGQHRQLMTLSRNGICGVVSTWRKWQLWGYEVLKRNVFNTGLTITIPAGQTAHSWRKVLDACVKSCYA